MAQKMSHDQVEQQMVSMMMYNLKMIYQNHSTDEYKMSGDITRSPEYNSLERLITDLKTIKKYPQSEGKDIGDMFSTLHKPVFKETVTQYITEPNERNSLYTAMFTVGYRVLVGEISRIYASCEATEQGMVYKPDKVSKSNDVSAFIRSYNASLNKHIDDYIRDRTPSSDNTTSEGEKPVSESLISDELAGIIMSESLNSQNVPSSMIVQEDVVDSLANAFLKLINLTEKGLGIVTGTIRWFFKGFKQINPISFMNACLMKSYQKKVDTFYGTAAMYNASKEAYEEYMKLPQNKRDPKVVEKYKKNIQKYNISMENQRAKIAHYDQRAIEEQRDQERKFPTANTSSKQDKQSNNDTSDEKDNDASSSSSDDLGF